MVANPNTGKKQIPNPNEKLIIDFAGRIRAKSIQTPDEIHSAITAAIKERGHATKGRLGDDVVKDILQQLYTAMVEDGEPGFWTVWETLELHERVKPEWRPLLDTPAEEIKPEKKRKYKPIRISELLTMPDQEWLIKDLLYEDATSVVYSMPGIGKSFLGVDWCAHLALGWEWLGRRTKKCRVIYVAAEGARGYKRRILAWCHHHKVSPSKLENTMFFIQRPIPLGERAEVLDCIEDINSILEETDQGLPVFIVLDTIFRCSAGMNINQTDVMSAMFDSIDLIKRETNATHILSMHHSGKDASRGMSGNMVLKGNADIIYRLEKDSSGTLTLTGEKVKDDDEPSIYLRLEKVVYGEGERDNSQIVVSAEKPIKDSRSDDATQKMIAVLPRSAPGLSFTDWYDAVHNRFDPPGVEKRSISRMTFNRRRDVLIADGTIRNIGTDNKPQYILSPESEDESDE